MRGLPRPSLLLALLCTGDAFAQVSLAALKPRNTLTLLMHAPLDMEIQLDDAALGDRAYQPMATGLNPLGDAISAERFRIK